MRPDQDVDLACLEVGEDALHIGGLAEARDHFHGDREVAVALAEGVPVLLREDRRRHEHERLLAVERGGERCAHRDFGLAEADVAADEPVHRTRRLEVFLDGFDRSRLIGCLAVRERRLEPLEPLLVEVERDALRVLAPRVELEELAGELADRDAGSVLSRCHALPPSLESVGALPSTPT